MIWPLRPIVEAWRLIRDRGAAPTGHADRTPLTIDGEGWLHGPGVERWPSVRHSPLTTPNSEPIGIVWHATAVEPGVPLWKRIQTYESGVDRAASWHVLIEADGTIYQSVSLERGSWHCGTGKIGSHRINRCTVGVELAAGADYDTRAWPAAQRDAAGALLATLRARYPILREHAGLLHSALDPKRRSDPGRTWVEEALPGLLDGAYGPARVA